MDGRGSGATLEGKQAVRRSFGPTKLLRLLHWEVTARVQRTIGPMRKGQFGY